MNNQEIQKTVKAISNQQEVNLHFSKYGDNIFDLAEENLTNIANLYFPENQMEGDLKAYADLSCCYHLFHNKRLNQELKTKFQLDENDYKIFRALEKVRIFLISKEHYLGIFQNILAKFEKDINLTSVQDDNSAILQLLLLTEFANQNKISLTENFEEIYFQTKSYVKPLVLQKVEILVKSINSQISFSEISHELIEISRQEDLKKPKESDGKESEGTSENKKKEKSVDKNPEPQESDIQDPQERKGEGKKIASEQGDQSPDIINASENKEEIDDGTESKEEKDLQFYSPYKVFTSINDRVILPTKLVERSELEKLRRSLDLKIDNLEKISKKLRLDFRKKLISKQTTLSEQSQVQGRIDRRKLTQIIANPFRGNFYITNQNHQYQNTVITILLDNSGSMRGSPIVMLATACEVISEMLEEFSIRTEILGFTTADWKGGKSKKSWQEAGSPKNPGRLNDLRHIVYKSANEKFKKSKINLGLMLKEGVLKENIDGEALLWAKSRLMQMPQERKILIVISDGTPVDDSTNSNNDEKEILIDHLHYVIKRIQKDRKIELVGIGIGHNVSSYYHNAITITNIEELGDVMIKKIIDLV